MTPPAPSRADQPPASTPLPTPPPPASPHPADPLCSTCGDQELPIGTYCPGSAAVRQALASWASYGERVRTYQRLWPEVGVPAAWAGWELATWPFERGSLVWQAAQHYFVNWQPGHSLLLLGPTGSGKTGLGIGLVREIMRRAVISGQPRFRARFVAVPQLLRRLREGYNGGQPEAKVLAPYLSCDLLLLDDLGLEKTTEWTAAMLSALIYERHSAGRAVVVTSNYGLEELEPRFGAEGERIIRRLRELCGPYIVLTDPLLITT